MRNILITFIALCVISGLRAQNFEYTNKITPLIKEKMKARTGNLVDIGCDSENNSYFLQQSVPNVNPKKYPPYISKFDKNLKRVLRAPIDLTQGDKVKKFHGIIMLEDEMKMFTTFMNRKDKKIYLFAESISLKTLRSEKDPELIGELEYGGKDKNTAASFGYARSEDQSKLLLYFSIISGDYVIEQSGLFVYDSDFSLLWTNFDLDLPQLRDGITNIHDYRVDNFGQVYIKAQFTPNMKKFYCWFKKGIAKADMYRTRYPHYKTVIYRLSDDGDNIEHMVVELENEFVKCADFLVLDKDKVHFGGIYSEKNRISAAGAYSFVYNWDDEDLSDVSISEFDGDQITTHFEGKTMSNFQKQSGSMKENDPFDYIIKGVFRKQNGSIYFIAEQSLWGRFSYSNSSGSINIKADLVVVGIDAENEIKSVNRIKKMQYFHGTEDLNSYCYFENNNNIYMLFSDYHIKETGLVSKPKPFSHICKFDDEGNVERDSFIPNKKIFWLFIGPKHFLVDNEGNLIYVLYSKDLAFSFAMGKIEIP